MLPVLLQIWYFLAERYRAPCYKPLESVSPLQLASILSYFIISLLVLSGHRNPGHSAIGKGLLDSSSTLDMSKILDNLKVTSMALTWLTIYLRRN